ncbi:MAG: hypothetical protein U0324_39125 [Polyangiales bacterium]
MPRPPRLAFDVLFLAATCCAPAALAQSAASNVAWPSRAAAPAPARAVAPRDATPPAAPPEPVTFTTRPAAQHALYVEGNTLGAIGSLGVAYAYRPLRGVAVSVGAGGSYFTLLRANDAFYGAQLMVHGLIGGDGAGSFEVAGGAAVVVADGGASLFAQGHVAHGAVAVSPAAFMGYRYQPLAGGLLFRLGAGWSYGNGVGLSAAVGGSF